MCSSNVGLLGSLYFIGIAVSTFVIPRLSDIYGRKLSYHISMSGHLVAYGAILLSRNMTFSIVMMFFFGFFSLGRASIGYIYMQEFLPTKQ
jgi:MFS family permease